MKLSKRFVFLAVCVLFVSGIRPCPENCRVITNWDIALCDKDTGACVFGCNVGYYGSTCNMRCDVHCEGGCQHHGGSCKCSPGYTFNTGVCETNTGEECTSNNNCLKNICQTHSRDDCLKGCKPGWFGKFCQQRCSSHCICAKESGNCSSCDEGWYGQECGIPCSSGCKDKSCLRNGICVGGCSTGSYGKRCELTCSPHCVSGCDQLTGDCVQCVAGRYGSTCQFECSGGCAGNNRDCDRDGRCVKGCDKGFYGKNCESMCPDQCFGYSCYLNGTCRACKKGFFGTFCHKTCLKCTDGICYQRTGECIQGCQNDNFGSFCNQTCKKCDGDGCDMYTGECTVKATITFLTRVNPYGKKETVVVVVSGVHYWVYGAITIVILVAVGLVYISCCLKRIRGFIYETVNLRTRPPAVCPVVGPGSFELTTPPTVCPISTVRPSSYIHPRHSGDSTNILQIQADRPDSYCLPHYVELDENLMVTPPQPPQETVAHAPVISNSSFSVVADVHVQLGSSNKENETGGEINIPLIAECFANRETEDLTLNAEPPPEAANYDHLFKDQRQY